MSTSLGPELPAELLRLLDGHDLEGGLGLTIQLVTKAEDGWPTVALLSVGEVLAVSPGELRLALWPGSSATANLGRDGQATLALVEGGAAWYIRIACEPVAVTRSGQMVHASFRAEVRDVLRDAVAYARLAGGIAFELPDAPRVLERWRETIEALRSETGS